MLKRIELTNFQKHESLIVDLSEGLTALKGSNEAGKSTLLRGVAYALFGARSLPYPLEETVTYGKPVGALKAIVDFVVDGVDYRITRGKGGAEINYAGGTITGQTETATFIGQLLGTDSQVAPKLILANQNDIRGALGGGAKATTDLIEKLAEFDQLDKLIDLIQAHLVTGSTAAAEAAVASAQAQMDSVAAVVEPNLEEMRAQQAAAEAEVTSLQAAAVAAATTHRDAVAALAAARETNNDIRRAAKNVEDAAQRLADAKEALKAITVPAAPAPAALAEAEAKARALEGELALAPVYAAVKPHLGVEALYGGNHETLEREIDAGRRLSESLKVQRTKLLAAAETTRALMVAGSCSLCGKDVSEVPEVLAKNAALEAQAVAQGEEAAALLKKISDWVKDEAELQAIKAKAKPILALVARHAHQFLGVDHDVTPPTLTWSGPTDFTEVQAARAAAVKALADLKAQASAAVAANAAQAQAERRVEAATADWAKASEALAVYGAPEPETPLQDAVNQAQASVSEVRANLDAARAQLERARSALREAVSSWEAHLRLKGHIEGALNKARDDLKALHFNNTLLKAVRAARPVIADKLWALVLGAVSRYFSEMRGERSLVTKTGDGFVVDGRSAANLSGSTLDVLGLAIRVALVKTFIPHAPLLVLDEPTAAMDAERTAATLGFLTRTGFKQTIIVSHEEATEAVADHLIQL